MASAASKDSADASEVFSDGERSDDSTNSVQFGVFAPIQLPLSAAIGARIGRGARYGNKSTDLHHTEQRGLAVWGPNAEVVVAAEKVIGLTGEEALNETR